MLSTQRSCQEPSKLVRLDSSSMNLPASAFGSLSLSLAEGRAALSSKCLLWTSMACSLYNVDGLKFQVSGSFQGLTVIVGCKSSYCVVCCKLHKIVGVQGEGVGVCTFANGDEYVGSLLDGVPHGVGLYHFSSKGRYAGYVSC